MIHLEDSDPLKCGSRGAGFCIDLGVRTTVEVEEAQEQSVEILFNGVPAQPASTTRRVVDLVLGPRRLRVRVDSTLELPVSQGMGLSGAGALSTAAALNSALGLGMSTDELVAAAHRAEVESRTGLGDVIAQSRGGLEMRTAPGAPPHGSLAVQQWEAEILLVVLDPPLTTRQVLTDPDKKAVINRLGARLLEEFKKNMSPPKFMELSQEFTLNSDLAIPELLELLDRVPADHWAAMAMLGNCLFIAGEGAHGLADDLAKYGECIKTNVYNKGL